MKFADMVGIKINDENLNLFEELYQDDDGLYEVEEVKEFKENGFDFKYKYALRVGDFSEFVKSIPEITEDKPYIAELLMVLEPEFISDKMKECIVSSFGNWSEDYNEQIEYIGTRDIVEYGAYVVLAQCFAFTFDDISKVLNIASNLLEDITKSLPIRLEKPVNLIGDSGYDQIEAIMNYDQNTVYLK
jgi:hypothetical protein